MAINQLKAGAVLNYVVLGLNSLVGLAYTPFMLRMLGQSEYGIYSLAASIIAYLSMLDFGFGNAVIRYTAKFRAESRTEEQYSMFGMFTVLYSLIGLVVIAIGIVLYFNLDTFFADTLTETELERSRVIVMFMIFNLAITFPLSIYGAIITAYEDFVFLRVVQIARIVLSTVAMIALLTCGYKAIAMVVVQTIFNIVTLGINFFYCRHKINIKIRFRRTDYGLLREVSVYSFWIFLNVVMDRVYWSTGQFVLGATQGTMAVAVFAVAIQLQAIYMMFSSGVSGVFLPRVTSMVAKQQNDAEISNLFIKVGRIQFIVISFILSGFIVFGRRFIEIWAGPEYNDAYVITLIFFVALLVPLIQNMGIVILQARNQMKFRSLLYLCISLISLVCQVPLSRAYGGIGCAAAIGGALFLGQWVIINIYYQKVQRIDIVRFWIEIMKMALLPIALVGVTLVLLGNVELDIVHFVFAIGAFSIVYLALFYRLAMNDYERGLVLSPIRKMLKKRSAHD